VTCPPLVAYLTEPLYGEAGILYADLDRDVLAAASFDFDPFATTRARMSSISPLTSGRREHRSSRLRL